MKKPLLISIFIVGFVSAFGQNKMPNKVTDYIKRFNLLPINQVDTITKGLPKDTILKSGWHVDHYASITQNDGPTQLNIHLLIYNDSIMYRLWYPTNFKRPDYDLFFTTIKEDSAFLYISFQNSSLNNDLTIYSKVDENVFIQFTNLVFKDFVNYIFVELNIQPSKLAYIQVTNIKTNKRYITKFSGICDSEDNQGCVDNVSYLNGKLSITATLTNKRTKKQFKETKIVKL